MALYHFLIFLLWCTTLETSRIPKTDQPSTKMAYIKAFNQTIYAIEKLLSFYEEQISQVNLDAIFGLRVAEGAIALTLTQHNESFWKAAETKYIYQKLSKLKQQAASINNRAQVSIKKQSKEYYDRFKDIVDKPWRFFKDFGDRKLPVVKAGLKLKGKNSTWDEATSDRCMSEALGSNPNHTECIFTPVCVNAITDQTQVDYGPTHQILFLTLAVIHGCEEKYSEVLKQHLGYDVDGLIENRCIRIMKEMRALEQPNVQEYNRDLYMEQAFVCALHGYEEFLTLKRLGIVLSWQRTVGCFGNLNGDDEGGEKKRRSVLEGNMGHRRNVGSFRSMRRLLVDVVVGHGCSAHESGVAAGLLGSYAKWLLVKLDTGTENINKTSNKNNPTTGNNNIHNNNNNDNDNMNVSAKDIYIRSMVISFVTALLTVAVVLSLYKLGENCCSGYRSKRKYKQLVNA